MNQSATTRRNLFFAGSLAFLFGASSVHCGSSGSSTTSGTFTGGSGGAGGSSSNSSSTGSGIGGDIGIDAGNKEDVSQDAFYQNDPPPMTCNTDAGATPPVITGTVECPSDKNLPGCPCATAGETAACWTGLRKDRGHGVCKDGKTTCKPTGEAQNLAWGDCLGEVLPTPGATSGKQACECFSAGHWQINNLSPCFYTVDDGMGNVTTGAISTTLSGTQIMCPAAFDTAPAEDWSTDTLKVDCTGLFKLCYTIKAGDPKNPQPTDCTIITSCTEGYYGTANVVQPMPDLLGWISDPSASACVQQFMNTGGYGEMSVDGESDLCEKVAKVFQRVTYCPLSCNDPNPPAMCATCTPGGGGNF